MAMAMGSNTRKAGRRTVSLSAGLNCPLKEPPGANNCCHSRFGKATSRGEAATTTITIRTAVLACDCHYAMNSSRGAGGGAAGRAAQSWRTSCPTPWPIKVHCVLRESWVGNLLKYGISEKVRSEADEADVHKWLMVRCPSHALALAPLLLPGTFWWSQHFCVILLVERN